MKPIGISQKLRKLHRLELSGKINYIDNIPYYQGRRIISTNSPIDGGVCIGEKQREAIVVDSGKDKEVKKLYTLVKKFSLVNGSIKKELILPMTFGIVSEKIEYNKEKTRKIMTHLKVSNDDKVSIDTIIDLGFGESSHLALICGAILELAIKEALLHGQVNIDRNSTYNNGRTWCRYTSFIDETLILDVAEPFFGKLEDGLAKGFWCYDRPENYLGVF